jgi:hypothetical protein
LIEVGTSLLLTFLATLGRRKQTPRKEKKKLYAKLQCQMGQWSYGLKEYPRHVENQCKTYGI